MSLSYVLITPARNEEKYIAKTLESVTAQTSIPLKWVIVNDGSTDRSQALVQSYAGRHNWIQLINLPARTGRDFAAKVKAFNTGRQALRELHYDIIGNLDADVSFEPDYFEFLLNRFEEWPDLGVAGTPFIEENSAGYDYTFTNIEHVSGAIQMFRRQCFDDIGGYTPNERGGIDWVAVTSARMLGWRTRTFVEKKLFHHRPIGTAGNRGFKSQYKQGQKDFFLGGHPLWELFRSVYQMSRKPYGIKGSCLLLGYFAAWVSGEKRAIPESLVRFNQEEQMLRLRRFVHRSLPG